MAQTTFNGPMMVGDGTDTNLNSLDNAVPSTVGFQLNAGILRVISTIRTTGANLEADAGTLDIKDGGTETQATSVTTTVAISPATFSGQITTFAQTAAAGVDVTFQVTNTNVAAIDLVLVSVGTYGGTADGIPVVNVVATAAGSFDINLRNTGAVALDALVVINWAVIKGSIT